jgi:hypothetical protein
MVLFVLDGGEHPQSRAGVGGRCGRRWWLSPGLEQTDDASWSIGTTTNVLELEVVRCPLDRVSRGCLRQRTDGIDLPSSTSSTPLNWAPPHPVTTGGEKSHEKAVLVDVVGKFASVRRGRGRPARLVPPNDAWPAMRLACGRGRCSGYELPTAATGTTAAA